MRQSGLGRSKWKPKQSQDRARRNFDWVSEDARWRRGRGRRRLSSDLHTLIRVVEVRVPVMVVESQIYRNGRIKGGCK